MENKDENDVPVFTGSFRGGRRARGRFGVGRTCPGRSWTGAEAAGTAGAEARAALGAVTGMRKDVGTGPRRHSEHGSRPPRPCPLVPCLCSRLKPQGARAAWSLPGWDGAGGHDRRVSPLCPKGLPWVHVPRGRGTRGFHPASARSPRGPGAAAPTQLAREGVCGGLGDGPAERDWTRSPGTRRVGAFRKSPSSGALCMQHEVTNIDP